jgi:serine phosphatase RsbU (regulator of sigma subunit)
MAVSTAAVVAAARDAKRGGDFHLVQSQGHHSIVVVGDVMGNGEAVAPIADQVCGELKQIIDASKDPAALLEELNVSVYRDMGSERFVTACVMVLDRQNRSVEWAFAGHVPPHWLDNGLPLDGAVPGFPLGVREQCGALSAHRRPLHSTEGMLIFTDGLEDVRGPGEDRFGTARITSALAGELRGGSPEEIVHGIKEIACEFGEGQLDDDMCVVALRVD